MWRLTDEQERLRQEIREVVLRDIQPRVREMEENCEYPRDLYAVMAEHRLLGLGSRRSTAGAASPRRRGAHGSRSSRRSPAPSR